MDKLRPINDQILVEYIKPKDRSDGGIIIPGVNKLRPTQAIILAVGPGEVMRNGELKPLYAKVGDKVLISMYGSEIEGQPNKKLRKITNYDILAVYK